MTALTDGFNKGTGKLMMCRQCTDADFELIKQHNRYKGIDFWNCKLKNLNCVLPLKKLESFCQYGGSVADYSALEQVPTLSHVLLNRINRYDGLAFIRPLTQLHELQLLYLSKLEVFPDLSAHTQLTTIRIWECRRLADISALANVPNLASVHILGTPHAPADFEFLLKLANLETLNATFRTVKENKLMTEMRQHYHKSKNLL